VTIRQNAMTADTVQSTAGYRAISPRRCLSALGSGLLATMLLMGLSSTAYAARCMRGAHFNLGVEGPWQRYMTVAQGRHCRVSLLTGNKRYPGLGGWYFERLNLVQSPSHGSVRIQGLSFYVYSAPSNYNGKDQFTVRACGHSGSQEGCANFLVDVTIVARNG
jgi:hypothetical protein